jgi:lactoylglutathione lyase
MIKGIAHTAYLVSNMTRSIAFYDQAFGFKKAFELNHPDGSPWIVYLKVNDRQFIELFHGDQPFEQHAHQSYQHLCLEVTDIKAFVKHLSTKHIALLHPIILGLDHNYQCWVEDPDGNPIEIMQYGPNALQLK